MKIVVCIKQVPDTNEVKIDPVTGTLIREGVPSIINPDDLSGIEAALRLKDKYGHEVIVVSMGPPQADVALREALAMGCDEAYLISDRRFGGADTWATSRTIAGTLKILGYDLIITGRQAIDGDTAQVGPQTAEKLGYPQITYAEEFLACDGKSVTIKRRLERGVETVKAPIPAVITVHGSAEECRARHAKNLMKYKHARTTTELQSEDKDYTELFNERPYLNITEWTAADLNTEASQLGLAGSPTKVKAIQNVVLTAKDSVVLTPADEDMNKLMKELIDSHVIG